MKENGVKKPQNDWGLNWLFYTLIFYFGLLFSVVTMVRKNKNFKKKVKEYKDFCNCPKTISEVKKIKSDWKDEEEVFVVALDDTDDSQKYNVLILFMDKVRKDLDKQRQKERLAMIDKYSS